MPDGSPWPKVSIVTPSYNQAQFIEETIRSVLLQGYPNLEYIIIDGGSADGSVDIIRKYEPWLAHWASEPDEGQADAVNKGYGLSSGEIIGWLNSDDTYAAPDGIVSIAKAYQKNPRGRIFWGDCQVIDADGQVQVTKRQHNYGLEDLLLGRSLAQPSFFIHKKVLPDVGYLDGNLHYALDWAYTIRLFSHYKPAELIYVPALVASSREYGFTKTSTGGKQITVERREFLHSYFQRPDLPPEAAALRSRAFMATYWKEAMLELRLGHLGSCLSAAWNAFRLYPPSIVTRIPRSMYRMALNKRGH
jgi:glycosyltransferase involved in cell wall biosynthesis